jgi:hypothetical protein
MSPLCLRCVSTPALRRGKSGDSVATKRQQVSTLFPLHWGSKNFSEVLRLGLEGTNPRISLKASVAMRIKLGRREQRWKFENVTKREAAVMVHDADVFACLSYSSTPRDRIKMDSKQLFFINGLHIQRVTKWAKTYLEK